MASLKNVIMEILMVYLMGSHWDEKTELHWNLLMELQMDLNLGLMSELDWVLQLSTMKDIMM